MTATRGTALAEEVRMIDLALSMMAVIAGGLTLELFAAGWAPREENQLGPECDFAAHEWFEECSIGNPS